MKKTLTFRKAENGFYQILGGRFVLIGSNYRIRVPFDAIRQLEDGDELTLSFGKK